jgi:hypothetical protein
MIILLSPAKSLDFETKFNCKKHSVASFEKETIELLAVMKKFSIGDLEKLMGISKKLAELNFSRFKNFEKQSARQAILAFDGDVYDGIEKKKYSEKDFEFAQNHLRILSGFYGILRPLDLIKPYRLEMGIDLKKSLLKKNLYEFWGEKISKNLNGLEKKFIINLASEEYFSVVNSKKISAKIINVIFKEKKNGVLKIIGINAKKARGLMANFAIKNKITEPEKLKNFKEENYKFAKQLSDELNWVFVR